MIPNKKRGLKKTKASIKHSPVNWIKLLIFLGSTRMEVSEKALKDFKTIWRKNNPDKELTQDELLNMAQRLLLIVKLVYKPIPDENKSLPP